MTDTQKLDALDKLIAAVEAGNVVASMVGEAFPDRGLETPYFMIRRICSEQSLDAAVALHNALLPAPVPNLIHSNARIELLRILKAYRAQVAR